MWNGRERVRPQACLPSLASSFQPLTAHHLHPCPSMTEESKIRARGHLPHLGPPLLVPFIVTVFTHHSSRIMHVPLQFLDMRRPKGLGEMPGSLRTGEGKGTLASVILSHTHIRASVF